MPNRERLDDELRAILPDLEAAIRADDRGWRRARSWPTNVRRAAAMALLLALDAVILFGSPRTDLEVLPVVRTLAVIAGVLVCAALAAALFLRPLDRRPVRRSTFGSAVAALTILPLALALLPAAHHDLGAHPESFVGAGADFWPRAIGCLLFGSLVGAPVAAGLLLVDRRPRTGPGRLMLAAGFGGAAGSLGLLLHCPLEVVTHRVTGHGAIAVAVALLLALALRLIRRLVEFRSAA